MKGWDRGKRRWLCANLLLWVGMQVWSQTGVFRSVEGVVRDGESKRALSNVNVSVRGTNIGTVTNAEGEFSLKIRADLPASGLELSHIGYVNHHVALPAGESSSLTIRMIPHTNLLSEVVIYADDPYVIVEKAIGKIAVNYESRRDTLIGFYRETVQKGRRYIGISEAVLEVAKTSYADRRVERDRVHVAKGRRLLSQKASDTLAVKVMGGPNISIALDLVKNKDMLLDVDEMKHYDLQLGEPTFINNRMHYVIHFRPRVLQLYALKHGALYIDCENLSFTRIEASLDMQDKTKATSEILYRKPAGLRFRPQELSYLVTYKNIGGKSYLNYIRNTIRFKCDWKKKLFATSYSVISEMVVTDRAETSVHRPSSGVGKAFGMHQIFYDKVDEFWQENFWENYNIIEPTESLEHAVGRLRK